MKFWASTEGTRPSGPPAWSVFNPLIFILIALGASHPASGQTPAKSPDPLNRDTPQSTVYSFLQACHERNYSRAWRYLDVRDLRKDEQSQRGPELAQQLQQILDRDVEFDVAALSRSPEGDQNDGLSANREHVDSFSLGGKTVELELERVTLRPGLSVWLFSHDSVALIPQLAKMTSDSVIERHLPQPLVSWLLVDTPLWRWIALLLLAGGLVAISGLVGRLVLWAADPLLKRLLALRDRSYFEALNGPIRVLFWAFGFRLGMEWCSPSALLRLYVERVVTLIFFFGLAWFCMVIVDLALVRLRIVLATKYQTISYSVLPLTARVAKFTIVLLAAAAILGAWGYNTTTILAGLGVGGLAIALAAQKTVENFFGGVAVISDRPVSVGDFCRFGDRVGTVEDIGLRSTRIRTLDRTVVSVPNGQFSTMELENFSKRDKMWFHLTLNLRRDTTPDQVRTLLDSITRLLKENPNAETGPLPVRFVGLGKYSLDLEVFAYLLTRDSDQFLSLQQELLLQILDAVQDAGTALALPTQTNIVRYLEETPGNGSAGQQGEGAARMGVG